jgi:hypothetical protein
LEESRNKKINFVYLFLYNKKIIKIMALRNFGLITQGEYDGKTIDEATQYAQEGGYTVRITEENGQPKMLTMDVNPNRINFRVKNGYVIEAYGG